MKRSHKPLVEYKCQTKDCPNTFYVRQGSRKRFCATCIETKVGQGRPHKHADVAESVYATDSKPVGVIHDGSIPSISTKHSKGLDKDKLNELKELVKEVK